MKEIAGLTVKLLLICAIMTALLAGINMVTAPLIAANAQKNFEAAMAEVMPEADAFTELESKEAPSETGVTVDSIYRAGEAGYVVTTVCAEGYGGDVKVMVGITPDLQVRQAKVMEMSETPGLGAKSTTPAFIDQYNGLSAGVEVIKNAAPAGNQIQAISGATITSKAVTKAVNAALEAAAQVGEGGGSK